ncbi:MAG: hypothetical protein ACPGVY_11370 [Mycobacterium sp.]
MAYAEDHASALAGIADAGVAVTFTTEVEGTHNPLTETFGEPTTSTVTGHAVRVRGDKDTYTRLGLVYARHPTLLFAPSTYGDLPEAGWTVVWDGVTYTVAEVDPVAPDGAAIIARVVCR